MAYVDGIVAAVPADTISAAAALPAYVNELLHASSGASTSVLLLSTAAGAAVVFVGLARIARRAGQARQRVMQV